MQWIKVTFRVERHCRRRGWTRGEAIRLADGRRWYLPAAGQEPSAPSNSAGRDGPAGEAAPGPDPADHPGDVSEITRRLLRENYELPDCTWQSLMTFDDAAGMSRFTPATSRALVDDAAP